MDRSVSAETVRQQVAAEVRAAAARKFYTQSRVANVLGITQTAVSRRYRAEVPFDVDELEKLAQEWDLPITAFFPAASVRPGPGGATYPDIWRNVRAGVLPALPAPREPVTTAA